MPQVAPWIAHDVGLHPQWLAMPLPPQVSAAGHAPQSSVPPQPSSTLPQSAPTSAHVLRLQAHTLGSPPPPQVAGAAQVPQFIACPQPSATLPQSRPSIWQLVGTHPPPPSGAGGVPVFASPVPDSFGFGASVPASLTSTKKSSFIVSGQPSRIVTLPTTMASFAARLRGTIGDLCTPCREIIAPWGRCSRYADRPTRRWVTAGHVLGHVGRPSSVAARWHRRCFEPGSCALVISRYTDLEGAEPRGASP